MILRPDLSKSSTDRFAEKHGKNLVAAAAPLVQRAPPTRLLAIGRRDALLPRPLGERAQTPPAVTSWPALTSAATDLCGRIRQYTHADNSGRVPIQVRSSITS